MAVSNEQAPNLAPSYQNIIGQLQNRATMESTKASPLDAATSIVKRADQEMSAKRTFEQKMASEGKTLVTDQGIDEFTSEINKGLPADQQIDRKEFTKYKGLWMSPDEIQSHGEQTLFSHTYKTPQEQLAASLNPKEATKEVLQPTKKIEEALVGQLIGKFNRNEITSDQLINELKKAKTESTKQHQQYVGQAGDKAVLFDPNTGELSTKDLPTGQDIAPRNKRILPADTVNQLADFQTLKKQINTVKSSFDQAFVGPVAARLGEKGQAINAFASEERGTFLANINSVKNQLLYLRSGKQINEKEYERLVSELPDEKSSVKDFNAKLKNFEDVYSTMLKNRVTGFEQAGYLVPSEFKQSNRPAGKILKIEKVK